MPDVLKYRRRLAVVIALAATALASAATAQEPAPTSDPPATAADVAAAAAMATETAEPQMFQWANEELYYSVRLNGVEAVRAAVRAGDIRYKDGIPYVAVSGTAQSTGIFHTIYPVNDRAHTFVNPETLRPLRSEKFFDENGKVRSYHVDFVHSTYSARVEKKRPDQRDRKFHKAIPGTTNDMVTWFYELRNKKDLTVGDRMTYYIYDGWKLYRLTAVVTKKEDVYTPLGWFKTYKVDFDRETLRTRKNKGQSPIITVSKPPQKSGSLWVSRDENLIPVKVAVSSEYGVGEAILIKYKLPEPKATLEPRDARVRAER